MPTETIEYRLADKGAFGQGPWVGEPDKKQWADPETGYPCLIVRGPVGALCGYVGVAPGHPAYGLSYDFSPYGEDGERKPLPPIQEAINAIEVHGGMTFAGGCQHNEDPAQGICHVPAAGEPDHVWWFGFDCAHAGDYSPGMDRIDHPVLGLGKPTGWGGVITYRDQAYVEGQVAALAKQLAALA